MVSSRARTFSTEGVVVRGHDLGEADRIVTVLTPFHGTVRAVARGARKPGSKLGGHLDLLQHVSMSIGEGRTLHSVSQADTLASFRALHRDLDRLSLGLYLAELSERFSVEGGANPALFRLLASSLGYLENTEQAHLLVRWFEARLLHMSGFAPEVSACVECGDELVQQDHVFSASRGGIVCPQCRVAVSEEALLPASVSTIKLLRHIVRVDWPEVRRLRVGEDDLRQVERIHTEHLHHVLDRGLKSSSFVNELRGRSRPSAGQTVDRATID